jgi:hypothetical protein
MIIELVWGGLGVIGDRGVASYPTTVGGGQLIADTHSSAAHANGDKTSFEVAVGL